MTTSPLSTLNNLTVDADLNLDNFSRHDLKSAFRKWKGRDAYLSIDNKELKEFSRFLGFKPLRTLPWIVDVSDPEVRRLINMINGPHGHTIIKILELKNANKFNP